MNCKKFAEGFKDENDKVVFLGGYEMAKKESEAQLTQAQATIKSLTEENAALRALLDKFITKSNGLSLWVRDEALSKKLEDYDDFLHERIVTMYEHQCKAEAILNGEK